MDVKMLVQSKDSAEKQIKSMSSQLAMSIETYKRGYDDILARKEREFDETIQRVNTQVFQLEFI